MPTHFSDTTINGKAEDFKHVCDVMIHIDTHLQIQTREDVEKLEL